MRKIIVLSSLIFFIIIFTAFNQKVNNNFPSITRSPQRKGNAEEGWNYIINGNYIQSGLPYFLYPAIFGKKDLHLLLRKGKNNEVAFYFNVVKGLNQKDILVPNCLQCHAEVFDGNLIVGLGRANGNFTNKQPFGNPILQDAFSNLFNRILPNDYEATEQFAITAKSIRSDFLTHTYGTNPGERLSVCLMQHHDPLSLQWSDKPYFKLDPVVIPSDVPAWWLLKKKAVLYYSGEGRGDLGKTMMIASLLTMTDTLHAADVNQHMPDVLAFIENIKPPVYPEQIDKQKATEGKKIFTEHCSSCHGNYGDKSYYPNLLIPQSVIGTDSLLSQTNFSDPQVVSWFNKSWFTKGDHPAQLIPFNGYIAPPLDGIWITAPYFHNGSVPTLEAVLNSKIRPQYWSRDFDHPQYNYDNPGWKFSVEKKPGNLSVYNTTLPGYGNNGHYFGDALTDAERKAVIEYLKTL